MKKICVWGTGKRAKRIYYLLKDKYLIDCFYDNYNKTQKDLYGIPIRKYEGEKAYIIIASVYWKEIMSQLVESGLIPIKDITLPELLFLEQSIIEYKMIYEIEQLVGTRIDYNLFLGNNRILTIYGNCQTSIIGRALSMHTKISSDYRIISLPIVSEYDGTDDERNCMLHLLNNNEFWNYIDVFMYQKVSHNNKFSPLLATECIVVKLREECKKIVLINIYFDGYFLQEVQNNNRIGNEINQSGIFPFEDKYVNELIAQKKSADEIIKIISSVNFFERSAVIDHIEKSIERLKSKEKDVDIVISDYIEKNYAKEQLFYSRNHPIEKVLIEYVNRIVNYMGYEEQEYSITDFFLICSTLKGQDTPIYPAVFNALKMEKYESRYYPNRYIFPERLLCFEDYQKKYIEYKRVVLKQN